MIVREPVDWICRLYSAPFEVHGSVRNLPLGAFIRAEWESVYKPVAAHWPQKGFSKNARLGARETLQLDRHPIEGRRFRNVVELRNVKTRGFLSFLERDVNAAVLRYEDLRKDPEGILKTLRETFGIEATGNRFDPAKRAGPKAQRQVDRDALTAGGSGIHPIRA